MFGLGWLEIGLLVLVLVLLFGVGPSGRILGRLFGTYTRVNDAKRRFTSSFNPLSFLRSDDPKDPPA